MDRHLIARKVMVDEIPKALVDDRFFHKRGAHAHGHSADDLASRGFGIENTAGGTYSEHSPHADFRSEEHTSELQSLMRISYAVFCLKKKKIATCNMRYKSIHQK